MNEKYYTPEIEDIRIGYICEIKSKGIWSPYIMDTYGQLQTAWSALTTPRMDGTHLRTEYLTSTQIESEGWKHEVANNNNSVHLFTKGEISLIYSEQSKFLEIFAEKESDCDREFYNGKCPSINEFRTICKLIL
jgi:hypothetical protein